MALDNVRGPSPASRKIRRLGVAVAIVVALYSAGWFYVASKIEDVVADFIARPGRLTIGCDGLTRTGTPFRIGFACNQTSLKDDATGAMLSAGAIRAVANIYNPGSAVVELDGPANVSLVDGTAITADSRRGAVATVQARSDGAAASVCPSAPPTVARAAATTGSSASMRTV